MLQSLVFVPLKPLGSAGVQPSVEPFREMRRLFAAEAVSTYIAISCTSTFALHIRREARP